jgi:hypothetical protein
MSYHCLARLWIFVLLYTIVPAQKPSMCEYIYPLHQSSFNPVATEIILRPGSQIDRSLLRQTDLISVMGSQSGSHEGHMILATDNKTLIYKPDRLFIAGEQVDVFVNGKLKNDRGQEIPPFTFYFNITTQNKPLNPYDYLKELNPGLYAMHSRAKVAGAENDTLPEDFPEFELAVTGQPADGYLFISPTHFITNDGYNLMITNAGDLHYYQKITNGFPVDFKIQSNGMFSYGAVYETFAFGGGGKTQFYTMDNSFTVTDSFQMGNGYVADFHEFQLLPNGHALLLAYDLQQVDLSQIVEGGHPGALVAGSVIQELDLEKNVIFQWRSWDHYDLKDSYADLTQSLFDGIHINSLELDHDKNLLISTLALAEMTKINRQTGEIIWRMGGNNNQFTFINESQENAPLYFMFQHDARRLSNGHILLFDGGDRERRPYSRVVEYQVDETSMTATKIWDYRHTPDILASTMGSAQRLDNGNTLIGWGMSSMTGNPAATEVDAEGHVVLELTFKKLLFGSYRAMRFEWNEGEPAADVIKQELHEGNIYTFDTETERTGVTLKVNSMGGFGYNEANAKRYQYGPVSPEFIHKAPVILPARVTISQFNIPSINADIYFDVGLYQFARPDSIVIYHREFEGRGLFIALNTVYNHVTNEIKATMSRFGEFIFAYPDFKTEVFQPLLVVPVDSQDVDQTRPVTLEWTPVGYASTYDLQVATDVDFTNRIIDETGLIDAKYQVDSVPENAQLYWRVKTHNEAGESGWSQPNLFQTSAPYIAVTVPDGGETWQVGLTYFIKWDDILEEDVIIELYEQSAFAMIIDTTVSTGGYAWEIPIDLENSSAYKIMIRSKEREDIFDMSNQTFAILDSIPDTPLPDTEPFSLQQNNPNPFKGVTNITYTIPVSCHVTLKIFNLLGKEVVTLVDGTHDANRYTQSFDARTCASGIYFYQLQAGAYFSQTKKMLILK